MLITGSPIKNRSASRTANINQRYKHYATINGIKFIADHMD